MNRRSSIRPLPIVLALAAMLGVFFLACLADRAVFTALDWPDAQREDWHRMLRILGFVPTWIIIGLAAALIIRPVHDFSRRATPAVLGLYLVLAPALAGLLAEPFKMLLRRERPRPDLSEYVFRPWSDDTFSTAGLGLPSSHAAVAFAGAAALCYVAPRGSALWLALAAGCGFTRLADRAHWLSDVVAAGVLGCAVAWTLARMMKTRRAGRWA